MLTPLAERNLTVRQAQILDSISRDLSNKEIARQLGVSVKTVEKHRTLLNRRFNCSSPIGLILAALREKFLAV